MNLRGVQKSLIKKLTVLIIFHFNFFLIKLFAKITQKIFGKTLYPCQSI